MWFVASARTSETSFLHNYSVGREVHFIAGFFSATTVVMDRNDYFVFDLTSIVTPIASASIDIYAGILESVDASEVFDLVAPADVGAAISDTMFLLAENGVGPGAFDDAADPAISVATALYGNIAGGPVTPLGSTVITSADDSTTLTIALDPAGVAFLNTFLGGIVVIGGSVSSVIPPGTPQQPFGFTGPDIPGVDPLTPTLDITLVPEPGTAILVAMGLTVLGRMARQRRE